MRLAWAFPSGFGGCFAEANRRANPVGSCCPGSDPGDEVGNEIMDDDSRRETTTGVK